MPKDIKIRDKVFILSLFQYGEGEPPFHEVIVFANSFEDARGYYVKYKDSFPEHGAMAISERYNRSVVID